MQRIKIVLAIFILSVFFQFIEYKALATHNRAGEITYEQVGTYTYKITLITYTLIGAPADRDELDLQFGDGTYATVRRIEKYTIPGTSYYRNTYVVTHTFPGAGTYVIMMEDPNRNEGVLNIPNSVNIKFAVKTTLQINPNLGANSTPIMLNPPIDKAARGQIFVHNPNAYDPDGDSLSFKLAVCLGDNGEPIAGYSLPNASIELKVDPISGDFIWNYPEGLGIYNIAMEIEEWRNGVKIGSIIRDMQVEVVETDNMPPVIEDIADYCVEADSVLTFMVEASDSDGESVTLSSTGGVYQLGSSPAVFNGSTHVNVVTSEFSWQTNCSHVRKQPYLVIFKAADNNPEQVLVAYENVNIHVVGPAPENLVLEPTNNSVFVKWDPSRCTEVAGYLIYRRNRRTYFKPEECELGVPDYLEYEFLSSVEGRNNSEFIDNGDGEGLIQGFEYCYIIVAYYPDGAESYASEEVCAELTRGVPIMLKASVSTTDEVNGAIHVQWMEPLDFDSVSNPGPYQYRLFPSNDLNGTAFTDPYLIDGLHNVNFIDTNYNTLELPRMYKMGLFNYDAISDSWNIIGVPGKAASLFLTLKPSDNEIEIDIGENVPWENYQYTIMRRTLPDTEFDTIAYTNGRTYIDRGLTNGLTYCYKVKSSGKYGIDEIPKPLINFSQEACAIPVDTVPSCPPELTVINSCDSTRNELIWTNPNNSCANDVVSYNIYYTANPENELELISTIDNPDDTTFWHFPVQLAGCYVVTAIDSFQNESNRVTVCADNCSYYNLPNTFTPDGNGINDIFKPYPYQAVDRIDMKIHSRWGGLVFKTEDPDINWDGKNMLTKQVVPSGVYYYVCDVWEHRLFGLEIRTLSGFIQVFSGGESNPSGK